MTRPSSPHGRVLAQAWSRFCVAGAVAVALYLLLPLAVQTVLYDVVGLSSVAAVAVGLRRYRPARPAPWLLLAGGVLLFVLGDVAYSGYDLLAGGPPFPSPADALYLAGYPAMIAAMAVVVRRSGARDAVAWQESCIWVLGVALLSWEGLLAPTLRTAGASVLARGVALAFPVLDLLVLLLLLRLVAARDGSPVFGWLAASMAVYLVSDAVYATQALHDTYVSGSAVDLGWLLAYVGTGALALHPRMVDLTEPRPRPTPTSSRTRLLLLGATALLAPGLLAWQSLTHRQVDTLPVAAAAALLFVLTTLRGAGLLRDVEGLAAELLGRERELHRRATRDGLTGLANRSVLHERLERDQAAGAPVSVALLDLDDFKHVNDLHGHEAGDLLLLEVGHRLTAAARPRDLVARLGGDEFAVVSDLPPAELSAVLLAGLAQATGPVPAQRSGLPAADRVAGSLGVAGAGPGWTPSELLRQADLAMYVAKGEGGRGAVVYRPEMSDDLQRRLETRALLTEAVALGQVGVHFQPVVDLHSSRLVGFEALARWHRPGTGEVAPGSWMPVAEETGLVVGVDAHVLRAAVRQQVRWLALRGEAPPLDLAVNASARTLAQPDVARQVLQVLHEEGLPPQRLVLEVTEGVLLDEGVGARLQALREAGVRVALDDFGTGWSSLSYLRRFPVDVLKLDRSFVTGVGDGPGAEAVPAAVLQLAAALGLEVVAEGVETAEQAAVLRRLGCRSVQGYLYGRPAAASALAAVVARGTAPARSGAALAPGP